MTENGWRETGVLPKFQSKKVQNLQDNPGLKVS